MKKNAILYLVAILVLNSCTNTPKTTTSTTPKVITDKPTLNDYNIGEKCTWLEKSVAGEKIRWEGKELQEVVEFKGTLGFWNGVDTVLVSSTLNQKQSSTPFRNWPLKVGKKWKYESDWVNAEGTPMKTSQDVEVVSYGEVTVLAGRFMAYKIEYNGTITNSIGGSAKMKEVYWYAPALKTNIKHIQDDGYGSYVLELYDYKSGK
jgi:hypothetical protein